MNKIIVSSIHIKLFSVENQMVALLKCVSDCIASGFIFPQAFSFPKLWDVVVYGVRSFISEIDNIHHKQCRNKLQQLTTVRTYAFKK